MALILIAFGVLGLSRLGKRIGFDLLLNIGRQKLFERDWTDNSQIVTLVDI